jgi:hypothetical protein
MPALYHLQLLNFENNNLRTFQQERHDCARRHDCAPTPEDPDLQLCPFPLFSFPLAPLATQSPCATKQVTSSKRASLVLLPSCLLLAAPASPLPRSRSRFRVPALAFHLSPCIHLRIRIPPRLPFSSSLSHPAGASLFSRRPTSRRRQ